ncbi:hypothetical protein [Microcoleus sp.]
MSSISHMTSEVEIDALGEIDILDSQLHDRYFSGHNSFGFC